MTLSLDSVVSVTINVSPRAATARGFGNMGIIGTSAVLPLYDRMRVYEELADMVTDGFSTTSPEYLAAQAAFSQEPSLEQLKVGRIFTTAQAAFLRGGAASTTLADYTAITDGGFDIVINGSNRTIADLNFSGAASKAAVAALIQTALNAALAGTTCTLDGEHFVITTPSTGTGQTIGYAVAPTTGGPSVDITGLLKFKASDGAIAVNGIALESVTAGLTALKVFDQDFYGFGLTTFATEQNIKDAAAWAQSNKMLFVYTTSDANAKLSASTTDLPYYMNAQGYSKTIGQFSTTNPNAGFSLLARAMVVDFDQPNSTITLKFKQEPGVAPEPLTSSEAAALKAKHANYYVDRGGFSMLEEGVVANGRFIDEVHGLDWLEAQIQTGGFNEIATSPTKVPNTDAGVAQVTLAIKKDALDKAVRNGLLAPGVWNGQALGEVESGEYLPDGYYVYALPVALQSQADRDARIAPPIEILLIGAGAIHGLSITATFQR